MADARVHPDLTAHRAVDAKRTAGPLVKRDPEGGWIALYPHSGLELIEPGFRWNSRAAARDAVESTRLTGPDARWEARQRAALSRATGEG